MESVTTNEIEEMRAVIERLTARVETLERAIDRLGTTMDRETWRRWRHEHEVYTWRRR